MDDILAKEEDLYLPYQARKRVFILILPDYRTHKIRMEVSDMKNSSSSATTVSMFGLIAKTRKSDIN